MNSSPDPNCKRCRGDGWTVHPNPDTRSWIQCECALPHPVFRALDVLRNFCDNEKDELDKYVWLRAIDELKSHSQIQKFEVEDK